MQSSTKKYKARKRILLIVLICFELLCLTIGDEAKPNRILPFFNWSLFSYVPRIRYDYNILITEINNEKIDPIYYDDLSTQYRRLNKFPPHFPDKINKSLQNNGNYEDRIQEIKRLFRDNHSIHASFMRRRFYVLSRWKFENKNDPKSFISTKVLEEYEIN